ncbi:similar to Saccharomyces cerevisiae YMR138W CIN4 GTP-binding protein involved in beta-tubulin (Tub2p) folding [Maudiozyma barnettii]|uniref:Similar to Saccharomyces cerevisiae YMR138W CIN4 GTP-binding protein involved in beta-tubulin (Tub2p) folding n=1 Tax=Maudiozyma barnettii TaxID=61262 RepID=A0A8H2VFW6_9SACH|nr:Arf family GTPase CIN4 [Kazachstania barnettii]CAB4254473.1 similar to Saccharomyces cerevisiae YMR138W CIN4 GTP-binding protein involved in beta-tubulin (Tub2p) folding [Kazachstania barnettii]CAD1782457.1 similar to Saccharomyces cerevisiae YMR138W CIN4 GTP-binding protein involved in beta-tubulin (Tub2p) folding [Kazachstania barnettii]
MGLLTIIKKQKQKDKEIRCLVIGLDNSGKSTVVNRLLPEDEREEKITPTIGFQIKTFTIDNNFNINLWDVGGQNTLRPFWENYFNKTDVLIWCIDISLPIRFNESFTELKNLVVKNGDRIGYDCHVVVILNKIDLLEDEDETTNNLISNIEKQIQDSFNSENGGNVQNSVDIINKRREVDFVRCSAISGEGIDTIKEVIVSRISR